MRRFQQTTLEAAREHYRKFMSEQPCDACDGTRLRPESLRRAACGKSIAEVTALTVRDAHEHVRALDARRRAQQTHRRGRARARSRAACASCSTSGLDYLTLDRSGPTLERRRGAAHPPREPARQRASGVMYVLDEPSIGLHQRDNQRLIATLRRLRDLGNTVLVVEHDEETIRAADHVVDFGPGAGHLGGRSCSAARPTELARDPSSLTGAYLSGRKRIEHARSAPQRRKGDARRPRRARAQPARTSTCASRSACSIAVTGVSGAGKSSLVNGILLPALARARCTAAPTASARTSAIEGPRRARQGDRHRSEADRPHAALEPRHLHQGVRRRSARSSPQLPEARARGYDAGRFSFNVKGGRCEACSGDGVVKVEMHFLADVYVPARCARASATTRRRSAVRFKGKNIADVLDTERRRVPRAVRASPGAAAHPRDAASRSASAT